MQIPILFEDEDYLVVNKPNNMLVYPSYYARNIKEPTLIDYLASSHHKLHTVHRLDYKTSGIVVLAKNKEAAREVQAQFETQEIEKHYLALVRGYTLPDGVIDSPVKDLDKGVYKDALTKYNTLSSIEINRSVKPYPTSRYSIVELIPKTGRQHQLRKHLNKISHPIIGDHKYGNRHHNQLFANDLGWGNMFLHAMELKFDHFKYEDRIHIRAELPTFWQEMMEELGFNLTTTTS